MFKLTCCQKYVRVFEKLLFLQSLVNSAALRHLRPGRRARRLQIAVSPRMHGRMNSEDSFSPCSRWVVYRLGRLGDVTLATGVLGHLAQTRGWSFVFVTRQSFADIFLHNPYISRVIALDEADLSFSAFASLGKKLAREYHNWGLLDLHGSLRSRLLSSLWRGPVRRYRKMALERRFFLLSGGRFGSEALRSSTVPQRYYMAAVEGCERMNIEIVHRAAVTERGEGAMPKAAALSPCIWLSDEERCAAQNRLSDLFGPGVRPVALHPFAAHAMKSWPAEHWRRFAALLEAEGFAWLALGRGQALFPGHRWDISNASSLRESCALLSWCRVLVTGDSGPMHLASGVGTPVLALFGPTTREWGFYPVGEHDCVLERPLACRPCSLHGRGPCGRNGECLNSISPEEALAAVGRICKTTGQE